MNGIVIMERPDTVSYEMLQDLLNRAHSTNEKKGLVYATAKQSAETLKKKAEADNGICYVAFNGSELVGTMTVSFRKLNYWYHNGNVAILKLLGVDPECRGKRVASLLLEKCLEAAKARGETVIVADSAENNDVFRKYILKYGFEIADYGLYAGNNFYTTVYVKWMNGCPYSAFYRRFRYNLKWMYIRFKYKPGKINRFTGKVG